MDAQELLTRLPAAEATLRLLNHVLDSKVLDAIRRSLNALNERSTVDEYASLMDAARPLDELRRQLMACRDRAWHPYWKKRPKGKPKPRPPRPKKSGGHFSVQESLAHPAVPTACRPRTMS